MSQVAEAEVDAAPPGAGEQIPTHFDFFRLPRPIQDRFLASINGSGAPRPILFAPASPASGYGWLALFVLCASVVLGFAVLGFADLKSALSLQSQALAPVYALGGGGAALALAAYFWARGAHTRYPYRLGQYLFPVGVLIAKSETLRWLPMSELSSVQGAGQGRVRIKFGGDSFTFPLPRSINEEQLEATLRECQSKLAEALARKDRRALAALDPLRDSGFSNPLSSAAAIGKARDQRVWRYGLAIIIGVTIGVLLLQARNKLGERSLYQKALAANTVESFNDYLERGGARIEVTQVLLPRAELQQMRGGATDTLERYLAANAESKIRPEIEVLTREALLRDLEQVRAARTLEAIAQFRTAHPQHALVEAELVQARHDVFALALADYNKRSNASDKVQELFRTLIAFSEKQGPSVELRYRGNIPASAERSDNAIKRSAYFTGKSSLPSQYFAREYAEPREKAAAASLLPELQKNFSTEVLSFSSGAPLEGGGELPKVERPTLFVSYTTEMSGGYTTNRPRNVYVGLGLTIYGEFVMPDGQSLYRMKFSLWLPPDINEISRDNLRPVDVYEKNAKLGFDKFNAKLLGELLPSQ